MAVKFTQNKQVVRDLQYEQIKEHLGRRVGHLRYFGLSSPGMKDVLDWQPLFSEFYVVERGEENSEWRDQHELLLTASLAGISRKVVLLRGDIDAIVIEGQDRFGARVNYPFDVVSLDYSGGLFYRNRGGDMPRLRAIEHVVTEQAALDREWLFFVSVRLDRPHDGEVRRTLENIRTELNRYGASADDLVDRLLRHEREEVRYKIYVPYFVNQVAAKCRLRCETAKTIIYCGNRGVAMMNFQFVIQRDERTLAPRFPQERLVQIINSPFREIKEGKVRQATLGLPKLLPPGARPGARPAPEESGSEQRSSGNRRGA